MVIALVRKVFQEMVIALVRKVFQENRITRHVQRVIGSNL